ncbi:MAG TPA: hypothetical protein ENI85_17230 [Deltaproteobacteria bacterium]|nr:hypothetical protein [Deltaproteobacteria bacterium]
MPSGGGGAARRDALASALSATPDEAGTEVPLPDGSSPDAPSADAIPSDDTPPDAFDIAPAVPAMARVGIQPPITITITIDQKAREAVLCRSTLAN